MSDTRQFIREATVIIGKGGQGVAITDLRISFQVKKTAAKEPNTATIRIYNLNPDRIESIKNEYEEVLLSAGYRGNVRLLFRGNIQRSSRFREGTDIITEVVCGDGDEAYRNSYMNVTLAKGTTTRDVISRAVQSMDGVEEGTVQINGPARVRGKVISGPTRDVLSRESATHAATWSIQNGVVEIVKADEMLPNTAILLSAETGLLVAPEITDKGVNAACLLNPEIHVGGAVKMDSENFIYGSGVGRITKGTKKKPAGVVQAAKLSADGIYKVVTVEHTGDTHSGTWDSFVEAVAL